MKVMIYGATGMVGQGVLRACLADPGIDRVLAVGRTSTGQTHPKLRELVRADLAADAGAEQDLAGYDACFFCIGVSSFGMDEARYTRITYDLTLGVAQPLARLNPAMTFVYLSGAGADSSERGPVMWARVRGRTENALLRLPFAAVAVFRPGAIQALPGIRSRTPAYRLIYLVLDPVLSLVRRVRPALVLTTDNFGRAMIAAVRHGAPKPVLGSADIYALSLIDPPPVAALRAAEAGPA